MFLSRLNEISGGCEKIVPVSESFWSNLKFFKNDRFNCVVVKVKFESEWNAVIQIHFRFQSLNGLPKEPVHIFSFFIQKCRHDINKLKFNRNTKFSNDMDK